MIRDEHEQDRPGTSVRATRDGRRASDERRVALCVARFYTELAEKLEAGARAALAEAGHRPRSSASTSPERSSCRWPPSTPPSRAATTAIVCLGAVIRGETDHYDYVCAEAARGIQEVQLETGVPCGFGVLTVDTMEQALDRVQGGSKRDTGRHAVEAVLASLEVKESLSARRGPTGFARA